MRTWVCYYQAYLCLGDFILPDEIVVVAFSHFSSDVYKFIKTSSIFFSCVCHIKVD